MAEPARSARSQAARRIPVSAPALVGNERKYVLDAIDSTWISSAGRYIDQFEAAFAELSGVRHAVAVCNGTAALHVALLGIGVGPGDEVIVPSLTYVACANAITYCGATPVFADSEPVTGNLDPDHLDALVTSRTKAILVVHLYGHPAEMDAVRAVAERYDLRIVEDAAEAHGARYRDRPAGSLGHVATFSFFGNKIVTTGEGGMVVTDDEEIARTVRLLRGQGQDPDRRYWFPVVGFNYRMTNIQAAIGLAQLERFDWHLSRRREVAADYAELLSGHPQFRLVEQQPHSRSAFWMNSVVIRDESPLDRDAVMAVLAEDGIETRPFFYPCHTMPPFRAAAPAAGLPVAEELGRRGISLPSSATLSRDDIVYVCDSLNRAVALASRMSSS